MNTPPGLLAAVCALWGAQTGYWLLAAAAAATLEAPRLVALRWNVEQGHFNRLSDLCSALIAATGVYLYVTFGNPRALMLLFQWLPLLLLPLAAAQAWGNRREVDIAAFVWTLRKDNSIERPTLNLAFPYLAVWVIAAASANEREAAFYLGFTGVLVWALWSTRPKRYPVVLWFVLLAATAGAGYGIQHGLQWLQAWMEEVVPEWINASGSRTDPYRSRTDLGHIGELKQDDAIVLRVRTGGELPAPLLLHRASYNSYLGGTWSARSAALAGQVPDAPSRWVLVRAASPTSQITVFDHAPHGNPVLSLPRGTTELHGLKALSLKRNGLGAVQAEMPPGYFSYIAEIDRTTGGESSPSEDDLRIPHGEQTLLSEITGRLGLPGLPPQQVTEAVKRYFVDSFGYSTYQAAEPGSRSALADFLLRTQAGHCEYFATATVLLLRAAGVPARYSTGFAAHEYSRLESAYVVRLRHAHSWASAYVNGRWVDVDTTPSAWAGIEAQGAAWWSPLADLWSWARFQLAQLGASLRDEERMPAVSMGIALLLGLWFGWRLYRQRRLMMFGNRDGGPGVRVSHVQGADSEWFLIEHDLAQSGLGRAAGETVLAWLARVRTRLPAEEDTGSLMQVAQLHYRYRFDPAGLPPPEREQLRALALRWLHHRPALPTRAR